MIGRLRGIIAALREDHVLLDVQGVGYLVYVSARTLDALRSERGEVSLVIETHVREDHIHLFGFLTESERQCFTLLTSVQGVGNRMAMNVLGVFDTTALTTILLAQDSAALTRVNGIGKRIAERIVTELKNKAPAPESLSVLNPTTGSGKTRQGEDISAKNEASGAAQSPSLADAVSALEALGYSRSDAYRAAAAAAQAGESSLDGLIRAGLIRLAG